jgi:hypothetical protein
MAATGLTVVVSTLHPGRASCRAGFPRASAFFASTCEFSFGVVQVLARVVHSSFVVSQATR